MSSSPRRSPGLSCAQWHFNFSSRSKWPIIWTEKTICFQNNSFVKPWRSFKRILEIWHLRIKFELILWRTLISILTIYLCSKVSDSTIKREWKLKNVHGSSCSFIKSWNFHLWKPSSNSRLSWINALFKTCEHEFSKLWLFRMWIPWETDVFEG